MAGPSAKDLEIMNRRLASVANHLMPITTTTYSSLAQQFAPIGLSNCRSSMNDKYHKVHGEVSTHEPEWRICCDESGKEYTDIIYEKAVGEGIAKVCLIEIL